MSKKSSQASNVLRERIKEDVHWRTYIVERLEELNKYKGYKFQLWNYTSSHSELIIRGTNPNVSKHNVHLMFQDVRYIEIPNCFDGSFWRLATDEELERVVSSLPNQYLSKEVLLCAESGENKYYILCADLSCAKKIQTEEVSN